MSILLPSKPKQLSNTNVSKNISTLANDDSGIFIIDNNQPNTNISLKTNNKIGLYISDTQRIGINIESSPIKRLVINDEIGESIRLIYDHINENKYVDINISKEGSLLFKTYNNEYVNFINEADPSITNIKINDSILYASATQLNYNTILRPGYAMAEKVLVLDIDMSLQGINELSLNNLTTNYLNLNNTLSLKFNSNNYNLFIENNNGNCIKMQSNDNYSLFNISNNGILNIYNNNNIIEFLSDKNNNLIYPLQLTTENNLNNTGIGIKFNTYNNNNIKRNMSSIETIITNNQNNNENSIIKFNNMNNGNLINTVTIRNDGYILCNTLMELSDSRTKTIIDDSDFNNSLERICKLKTYNFVYKNDTKKKIHKGVLAQELYEIIPSAIHIEDNGEISDLYTISNKELISYLIDSIKALNDKLNKIS